jgi:predicted transglutaminase-like cysteine proteinase
MFENASRAFGALCFFLICIAGRPGAALAQARFDVAAVDPAFPSGQTAASSQPFGLIAVPVSGGELLTKWNGLVADIRAESNVLDKCRAGRVCPAPAERFLAVIAEGRAHTGRARLGVVNRAINMAIRPTSDIAQWGVVDRWSAPLATLTTGRGDCEDYAIAKYVALRQAGIAADDLRLIILRDLSLGEDHAVVAVHDDGRWVVLDNRRLALVADVDLRRAVPLFVLDQDGVRQYVMPMIAGDGLAASAATVTIAEPGALAP